MATQAIVKQLVHHPGVFMKQNMVMFKGTAPENQEVINVAMLDAQKTGRRRSIRFHRKVDANSYVLRHNQMDNYFIPKGSPNFNAVWSGYKGGESRTAQLPSVGGPDIMLTPMLSGCTVVCTMKNDGSAIFSHYNLKDHGSGQTLQGDTMRAIAISHHGRNHSALTKEDYYSVGKHSESVTVCVVGFRKSGRWEFWAQYSEYKGDQYHIRRVQRIR
ncbi:MAG: hypothetical protein GY832_29520 [Chloroflexi bacterium]|nr:hypothetical protein [Chloroflexota bacterium]